MSINRYKKYPLSLKDTKKRQDSRTALHKSPSLISTENTGKNLLSKLPNEVLLLFKIFEDNIFLVGGSVRDLILNKAIHDYDFASQLLPQQIIQILEKHKIKSIPTGLKYGTITAVINHKNFQITTLRTDYNYQGRFCDVNFTDNLEIDASRRDFTINALYLDRHGKIYDFFNGIYHLKNNKVIFINNPNERITEDYLRILRFFRFSCYYAKKLNDQGTIASINNIAKLESISKERIREEFFKILKSKNYNHIFKILRIFKKTNLDAILWQNEMNILRFKKFLKYSKYQNIELQNYSIIASLFIDLNLNIDTLNKNLVLTKIERKFLNEIQQLLLEFSSKKLTLNNLNYLLTQYSQEFIMIFYILFKINKKNINSKNLFKILDYIKNIQIKDFPLIPKDLINIKLPKHQINNHIKKLKKIWANSNFKATKQELINYAKTNLVKY
jgi:poly(A) polymerase